MAAKRSEVLELRGRPHRISAVVHVAGAASGTVQVRLKAEAGAEPVVYNAQMVPFGAAANEIRLRLPSETPPGMYQGSVGFEDGEWPVRIEVEADLRLRVHPRRSRLLVHPGRRVEFHLTIANLGNTDFEVPHAGAFGVYEAGGLDSAIGRALRADLGEGDRRIDRLLEEISSRHGGLVRIEVATGAGALTPGAARDIAAVLEIPSRVTGGRTFSGVWRIGNLNHGIVLDTEPAAPAQREGEQ